MESKLFELENLDAEVRRCTRGKATLINDKGKQYIKYHNLTKLLDNGRIM